MGVVARILRVLGTKPESGETVIEFESELANIESDFPFEI